MEQLRKVKGYLWKQDVPVEEMESEASTSTSASKPKEEDKPKPAKKEPDPKPKKQVVDMPQKAKVYRLQMHDREEEEDKYHSIVQLPPDLQRIEHVEKGRHDYEIRTKNQEYMKEGYGWTYNIVFIDNSRSMYHYWFDICRGWNRMIEKKIDGHIDVYSFDDRIRYMGSSGKLNEGSFSAGGTNLTRPLIKLKKLIIAAPQRHVRVFFMTDGCHKDNGRGGRMPEDVLRNMRIRGDRRIDVFVLALGYDFPVDLSIKLRSKLHSGPPQIPTMFWAKNHRQTTDQVAAMCEHLYTSVAIDPTIPPTIMPKINEKRMTSYSGEYLYFKMDPETLMSKVKLLCFDDTKEKFEKDWRREAEKYISDYDDHDYGFEEELMGRRMMMDHRMMARKDLKRDYDEHFFDMMSRTMDRETFDEMAYRYGVDPSAIKKKPKLFWRDMKLQANLLFDPNIKDVDTNLFQNTICKIWCSILLQKSKNGAEFDMGIYDVMKEIFSICADREAEKTSEKSGTKDKIAARIERKARMTLKSDFDTFIKESKETVDISNKFGDSLLLAEKILKTTVEDKYRNKVLKTKGYGDDKEWKSDMDKFIAHYKRLLPQIKQIPEPTPEDSCRITLQSFIGDLQDDGAERLLTSDKYFFLKEMTFAGVPIYSPIKDSTQMNPWTLQIWNICLSPYEIVSPGIMEAAAKKKFDFKYSDDKSMYLEGYKRETKMNIVVPLIPREHCDLLKPLITSTIFAAACSYCILKNANIVDKNCHLAALGCIWMRSISRFPVDKRPEYIKNRILNIEANGRQYMSRPSIAAYIECMFKHPQISLTTEAADTYNNITMKCESLIKPTFLLHLAKDNEELVDKYSSNLPKFIRLITMEFFGRCISKYQSTTPFIDFFLPAVEKDSRQSWLDVKSTQIFSLLDKSGEELLIAYPDLQSLKPFVEKTVKEKMEVVKDDLQWTNMVQSSDVKPIEFKAAASASTSAPARTTRNYNYDTDEEAGASDDDDDDIRRYGEDDDMNTNDEENYPIFYQIKSLSPNFTKINKLRHSGSVGQVTFNDLKAWANEMLHSLGPIPPEEMELGNDDGPSDGGPGAGPSDGGPGAGPSSGGAEGSSQPAGATSSEMESEEGEEKPAAKKKSVRSKIHLIQDDIDDAFNVNNISLYIYHALMHRGSRERLRTEMITASEAIDKIEELIEAEWKRVVTSELIPLVEKRINDAWMGAYNAAHLNNYAIPMTRRQLIEAAQNRGIQVNEQNFNKVYKYRPSTGLCRNCCMIESCPLYLQPRNNTNAHIEVERLARGRWNFPDALHLAAATRNDTPEQIAEDLKRKNVPIRNGKTTNLSNNLDDLVEQVKAVQDMYKKFKEDQEKDENSKGGSSK